jgi:hypothetical protein
MKSSSGVGICAGLGSLGRQLLASAPAAQLDRKLRDLSRRDWTRAQPTGIKQDCMLKPDLGFALHRKPPLGIGFESRGHLDGDDVSG